MANVYLQAGLTTNSTFLCNPYLAFAQYMKYQTQTSTVPTPNMSFIPSFMINGTASVAGVPYGDGSSANTVTPLQLSGPLVIGAGAQYYSGLVRVHGVEIDIEYTGTELNKGGILSVIHGANNWSCCTQYNTLGNTQASFGSLQSTVLPGNDDFSTAGRIGGRVRFVLRPTDPSFFEIRETYFSGMSENSALGNSEEMCCPAADSAGVLPIDGIGAGPSASTPSFRAPHGWTLGFSIIPAVATAGATLNYVLRVRVVTDELVVQQTANPSSFSGTPSHVARANPLEEAHIRNALSAHHLAAAQGMYKEVLAKSEHGLVTSVESAAKGAAMEMGAKALGTIFKTGRGRRL